MKHRNWVRFLLIVFISNTVQAQVGVDEQLRHLELKRLQMETDRLQSQAHTRELMDFFDRQKAERKEQEAAQRAYQVAAEQAEAARKAELAAEDLKEEISRAEVSSKNTLYLACLLAGAVGFLVFVVKRKRKEIPLQEQEKFGLITMIVSFLLATLALMLSADWVVRLDFLNNIMTLRLQFILDESDGKYFIDFPTKYFLLASLSTSAYGVTTYLGITPVPRKHKVAVETRIIE